MQPYYDREGVTIYHGDCREILPSLPPLDVVLTDPVWPNAVAELAGSDDPWRLFADAARHFPRLARRAVIHLGCDSDPRFLAGLPPEMPLFRVCWLDYTVPNRKGRKLYGSDVAYVFGEPPKSRPGARVIPGYCRSDGTAGKNKLHPCARNVSHVKWLIRWFAAGVVLDPFCGIGTTLVAAKYGNWPAIGIEIEERYCEIAARRLDQSVLPFTTAPE